MFCLLFSYVTCGILEEKNEVILCSIWFSSFAYSKLMRFSVILATTNFICDLSLQLS